MQENIIYLIDKKNELNELIQILGDVQEDFKTLNEELEDGVNKIDIQGKTKPKKKVRHNVVL